MAVRIDVRIDDKKSRHQLKVTLPAALFKAGVEACRDTGRWIFHRIYESASAIARTGHLAESLLVIPQIDGATVHCRAAYAAYVDLGSPPHDIYGRPWLRFFWEKKGKWVYARHVRHPGFKGREFFSKHIKPAVEYLWRRCISRIHAIRL